VHYSQNLHGTLCFVGWLHLSSTEFLGGAIASTDLWGDETNVLIISQLPFERIATSAFQNHVGAPPFTYWLLWLWNPALRMAPPEYIEILARLPFMLLHALAAVVFTSTCLRFFPEASSRKRMTGGAIFFFTYFFNPLLFAYSLEVKFYTLTALGSVVILFLQQAGKLFSFSFIPLHLFFYLSSFFHYILMIPYIAMGIMKRANHLQVISFIAITLYMYYLSSRSGYLLPAGLSSLTESYGVFFRAFSELASSSFPNILQQIFLLCILGAAFIAKKSRWIVAVLIFYLLYALGAQLYFKYFDLRARHFLFIMPTTIFMFFYVMTQIPHKITTYYLAGIFFIFTLPWAISSYNNTAHEPWRFKDVLGYKKVFTQAKTENKTVVLSIDTTSMPESVGGFYLSNFNFYSHLYRHIGAIVVKDHPNPCEVYGDTNSYIVFGYHNRNIC
jgi:hypothetical protein